MIERETNICDECGSEYYVDSSRMESLCPNCSFHLYGYKNCPHKFEKGRCIYCFWNGKTSQYLRNHIQEKEKIFVSKYDFVLPFADLKLCKSIVDEAVNISSNSVFFILEKIARQESNQKERKELLNYVNSVFNYGLNDLIFPFVKGMVEGKRFKRQKILEGFKQIKEYENEYSALNILYFSYSGTNMNYIDNEYNKVIKKWKGTNV